MRAKEILVEYRRDVTLQKLGDKISVAAQREKLDAESVIEVLEKTDPTPNKQYVPWLAREYISGKFRTEDSGRVKEVLINFIKLKPRLSVEQRDLNRIDFYSLDKLIDSILNPEISSKDAQAGGTFPVVPNSEVLYNGPLGQLSIPQTEEASCELGRGTKWCTASKKQNMFDRYNEDGNLYIWRDRSGEKYQFHFETIQFMNAQDHPISAETLNQIRTKHPVLKKLFVQKEKEIAKDAEMAYAYANDVLHGRWPEAEPTISQDVNKAYKYALYVIKGRWREAEPTIITDPWIAYCYARDVIKGQWREAEPTIINTARSAYCYARYVIKGRWREAEPTIAKDAEMAYAYARDVIKGQWREAEPTIASSDYPSRNYARSILGLDFTESEDWIKAMRKQKKKK